MSQDRIELLFSSLRNRLGCNNNSNVLQLESPLRQIIFHNDVVVTVNCQLLYAMRHFLNLSQLKVQKLHNDAVEVMFEDNAKIKVKSSPKLSPINKRKLEKKIQRESLQFTRTSLFLQMSTVFSTI